MRLPVNSTETMLKISTQDEPYQVTLKLEGSLAGTWVTDLEDSWRAVNPTLDGRPLCVHLTAVEHVDNAGRYLLAMLQSRGVLLAADGIVMTELVRTIQEDWPPTPKQTSHGRNRKSPNALI
jgi:ABC-type transporter Mla MlaB component